MIKYVETENEKFACFDLICLEIAEEIKYNNKLIIPDKERILNNMESERSIFLIDLENDNVVGYICANIFPHSNELTIDGLFVKNEYRRKKIGTKLVNRIFAIAKKQKMEKVTLWAYSQNEGSVDFYKKLNFKEFRKEFSIDL